MKKLILILSVITALSSCKKPSNDPMPKKEPTLYFLEFDLPPNTKLISVFDGDTIVDESLNGNSRSFTTIDKGRSISYSSSNPISVRVRDRILTNYNSGQVYIEILNTSSGKVDLSSLPE